MTATGCGTSRHSNPVPPEAGSTGQAPPAGASVLQFHARANRDGLFADPALTQLAAQGMHLDPTFQGAVQGNVYASPLYVESGPGGRGAFYVATEDDRVYALDETTGDPIWQVALGTPATQTGAGCGNISPIGITGTPAIDLASRVIVFDAVTADASGAIAVHTVHALSIDDGSERWRLDVSTVGGQNGEVFASQEQNQRSAVLIAGDTAYVAFGGHAGDCGDFRGWIMAVPLGDPSAARAFATATRGAGFWAAGGPASDGADVYAVSGNSVEGTGSPNWAGSECVYRFGLDLSQSSSGDDFWVPDDWPALDDGDLDLGGSGALVIDRPGATPSALLVAFGKDGNAYLLDRAHLGGLAAAPLARAHVSSGEIINAAAWASVPGGTFVAVHSSHGGTGIDCPAGQSGDLVVLKVDPAAPQPFATAWCADSRGQGSPIVTTSDGARDALVWTAGAEGDARLHAWDLATGAPVFTGGAPSDALPNVRRFTTPIVVHGRVIVAGDGRLYALRT
ncbi:MAG TPA: PQQ-binding-like beta-propeller repeat protein [Polyangiaceae bacterium]|nr:PQQ-binding-like beta-propeller repeat protein [Polyangiaceae bacterium]